MQFVNEVKSALWYFTISARSAEQMGGFLFLIIWAPGTLVTVMSVVGMCMSSERDRGGCRNFGTSGQRMIWTVSAIGILWACLVLIPLFVILSAFSIPLSSTCNSLASAHEESYFRAVLGNTVMEKQLPNMTDIVIDCLILNKSVFKYYSNRVEAAFQPIQNPKYQVSGSLLKKYFSTDVPAAPFQRSIGTFPLLNTQI